MSGLIFAWEGDRYQDRLEAAAKELERRAKIEARLTAWLDAGTTRDVRARRKDGEWRVALFSDWRSPVDAPDVYRGRDVDYWPAVDKALDAAGAP